jgi:hypothetical protein
MISTWKPALELCLDRLNRRRDPLGSPRTLARILAGAAIFWLAGCGGGSGSGSTAIKSVTVSPASASVNIDAETTLTATVTLTNSSTSTTTTVTWEVNGVAGGNAQCGTISASPSNQLEGIYTAPGAVPSSSCGVTGGKLGEVAVTAVASQTNSSSSSSSSSSGTVISNTAILTVGTVLGLTVSPPSAAVPAGGSQQFSAILNGVAGGASWSLSSSSGGNLGSIDANGLYTAPPFPPPGNSLTVTATATGSDGSIVTATATVTATYSDHSLSGPYAFSYTGNDGSGFFAVAGRFVADGNGKILGGVEDIQSFLDGTSIALPILPSSYSVGSDGRGTASIVTSHGNAIWRFALSTNLHAQLTRFDTDVAGGGSIDQQDLNGLTNSLSVITGRYTFSVLGTDGSANYLPLGMAGEFPTDGAGNIPPNANAVLDVNGNGISNSGTITRADTTLNGSYTFDPANPGTGRGTLTLQSSTIGSGASARVFAFYTVGVTTNSSNAIVVSQLHLIEIDGSAFTAGDMFVAATTPGLANATYVFTAGGNVTGGSYAAGGAFASDGVSTTSNGTLDINSAGSYNKGASLTSCSFSVNSTTGRIDLSLAVNNTCPSQEFAAYPTALGSVVLLELDSSAVATGLAYQQCGPLSTGCAASSPSLSASAIAFGLTGQGLFHSPPATSASFQPDLDGELSLSGTSPSKGDLDIDDFTGTFAADPLGTTGNSIGGPTDGRGTVTLAPTNPAVTYNLVYYLIDDHTTLLLSSGQTPVAIGMAARQF